MKTKAYLSKQEIYDGAVRHLFGQGAAAILPRGGAAYHGQGGRCCPIGNLIGVRDYTTSMESVPVRYILKPANEIPRYMDAGVMALRRALKKARIDVDDRDTVELLSKLQNAHDVFGTWEWKERLHSIARQFGLSGAVVDAF
ncbi:hypothetical protein GO998_01570 [Ralstonia syzygii]|uniref:Uncharacterized protein n=1 Tax=Ralstonia syzygii TaxID=28097 RepID=A0ABX7ZB20_9RALS|nr:hypothetical protein [Ralstonia syzygii]QUP52535.1 hypothetical protein GO998_01570 [Ralstonia syzygii]